MIGSVLDRFRRGRRPVETPRPAPTTAPTLVASSPSNESSAWRTSPPMPVTGARHMGTQQGLRFVRGLSTRSTPAILRAPAHEVSSSGPIGVARSIATLVPPGRGANLVRTSLPIPSAPGDESSVASPLPVAERRSTAMTRTDPSVPSPRFESAVRTVRVIVPRAGSPAQTAQPVLPRPFARPMPASPETIGADLRTRSSEPLVAARSIKRPPLATVDRAPVALAAPVVDSERPIGAAPQASPHLPVAGTAQASVAAGHDPGFGESSVARRASEGAPVAGRRPDLAAAPASVDAIASHEIASAALPSHGIPSPAMTRSLPAQTLSRLTRAASRVRFVLPTPKDGPSRTNSAGVGQTPVARRDRRLPVQRQASRTPIDRPRFVDRSSLAGPAHHSTATVSPFSDSVDRLESVTVPDPADSGPTVPEPAASGSTVPEPGPIEHRLDRGIGSVASDRSGPDSDVGCRRGPIGPGEGRSDPNRSAQTRPPAARPDPIGRSSPARVGAASDGARAQPGVLVGTSTAGSPTGVTIEAHIGSNRAAAVRNPAARRTTELVRTGCTACICRPRRELDIPVGLAPARDECGRVSRPRCRSHSRDAPRSSCGACRPNGECRIDCLPSIGSRDPSPPARSERRRQGETTTVGVDRGVRPRARLRHCPHGDHTRTTVGTRSRHRPTPVPEPPVSGDPEPGPQPHRRMGIVDGGPVVCLIRDHTSA